MEIWHLSIFDWISLTILELLTNESTDIPIKLFLLLLFDLGHCAIKESLVLPGKWTYRRRYSSVEDKVHCPLVL